MMAAGLTLIVLALLCRVWIRPLPFVVDWRDLVVTLPFAVGILLCVVSLIVKAYWAMP